MNHDSTTAVDPTTVIYGAFKGMGDLLCAAPAIVWELNRGSSVVLLVFPQLPREFLELIDFGPNRAALDVVPLPTPARPGNMSAFCSRMSRLSPGHVWLSPHSPGPAASWRIPLLLSVVKRLYWRDSVMGGAASEPLSRLFDVRVPVDRSLPFADREWLAYASFRKSGGEARPSVGFTKGISQARADPPAYDLLIHPGAGAKNRAWPPHHFATLLRHMPEHYRIAVVGIPDDVAAMKAVLPAARKVHYSSGTLEHAIMVMARSRVLLTMDSGPMFFAQLLRRPTVSLFGASDPAHVIGHSEWVSPMYERKWACQPCGNSHCTQKSVLCMESLDPQRVAARVLDLLRDTEQAQTTATAMRATPAE